MSAWTSDDEGAGRGREVDQLEGGGGDAEAVVAEEGGDVGAELRQEEGDVDV